MPNPTNDTRLPWEVKTRDGYTFLVVGKADDPTYLINLGYGAEVDEALADYLAQKDFGE